MPVRKNMDYGWSRKIEQGLDKGYLEMATDIHKKAGILAPKDTRALLNSGLIKMAGNGFKVTFGNSRVPYARRRHFENKRNPQTVGYLDRAGEAVTRGSTAKYFRNKIK